MRASGRRNGLYVGSWTCPRCRQWEVPDGRLPPSVPFPRFRPITVAEVDAHNGLWMVKWRTGLAWRVGPLRRGEWDADRLERLTECGMPLDDEGQPTTVEAP